MEQKLDHAFRANGRRICIATWSTGDPSAPTMECPNLAAGCVYGESCVESNVGIGTLSTSQARPTSRPNSPKRLLRLPA